VPQDLQQLHLEDEVAVGWDLAAGTASAVGEVGGDVEFPFVAGAHELEGFGPALDQLADAEGGGLATGDGAVEDGAIGEGAVVVDGDGVVEGGRLSGGRAGGDGAVAQAAGGGDPAGGIRRERPGAEACRGGGGGGAGVGTGLAGGDRDQEQGSGGEGEGKGMLHDEEEARV